MKLGGYLKKEGNNLVSTCNTCGRDVKLNGNTKDWFGSILSSGSTEMEITNP
ncbi:MAG: hypothetical protein K8E24_004915 [Methanobacterium paludis]|nr:hypothetical protein [Methanobacterium paludis]